MKKINIPVHEWQLLCSGPEKGTDIRYNFVLMDWLASVIFHYLIFYNKPGQLPTQGGIAGCIRILSDSPGLVK